MTSAKINTLGADVYRDGFPNTLRGEPVFTSSMPNTTEALTERLNTFRDVFLPKILTLVVNRQDNYVVEVGYLDKRTMKEYAAAWENLFQEIKQFHEEKQWRNPFLNRLIYNTIMMLPVRLWTDYLTRLGIGMMMPDVSHEVKDTKTLVERFAYLYRQLDLLKKINIHFPHGWAKADEYTATIFSAFPENDLALYKLKAYFWSGQTTGKTLTAISEENKTYLTNMDYLVTTSPGHYTKSEEDLQSWVDAHYEYMVLAYFQQYFPLTKHNDFKTIAKRRGVDVDLYPQITIPSNSIYHPIAPSLEEIIEKLKTSTDSFELMMYREMLGKYTINALRTVTDKERMDMELNFIKHTQGTMFYTNQVLTYQHDIEALLGKVADDRQNDPLVVAESEPNVRWIRTLKGELFVNRVEVEENVSTEETSNISVPEDNDSEDALDPETLATEPNAQAWLDYYQAMADRYLKRKQAIETAMKNHETMKHFKVKSFERTSVGNLSAYAALRTVATTGISAVSNGMVDWAKVNGVYSTTPSQQSTTTIHHPDEVHKHPNLNESFIVTNKDEEKTDDQNNPA